MLLTFLITSGFLSLFFCIYQLSKYVSCGYCRRLRWRRIRRSSDLERYHEIEPENDFIALEMQEKGMRSPHQE